jgi:hypothetical protein
MKRDQAAELSSVRRLVFKACWMNVDTGSDR